MCNYPPLAGAEGKKICFILRINTKTLEVNSARGNSPGLGRSQASIVFVTPHKKHCPRVNGQYFSRYDRNVIVTPHSQLL